MKKTLLSYIAPNINIYKVVAERGYQASEDSGFGIPGYGSEEDELI